MGYKEERNKRLRFYVTRMMAMERIMQRKSQQEIADKLGTSKSNISRLEKGGQNITVDYIQAMAEALGKEVKVCLEDPRVDYGNCSIYELKLYDEVLMEFQLERGVNLHAEIIYVNEERRQMLPLDVEISQSGIIEWLRNRVIPGNRELAGSILKALDLDVNDLKGIIDLSMGLSLNDSYWVVQKEFEGTYADYNLYQNRFDETLSIIAYVGYGNSVKKRLTSPELTTGGMLRKAWHFNGEGDIWLYKSGTSGFANLGNEPFSEYLAYQIAEKMGLHAVRYELENWHGILASKCRLFTDIDTSYIPIGRIVKQGGIDACIEFCKDAGDSVYQELASLLVFDAVIVNEDRHFGNFGVLRDNHTGVITGLAPIYDNGMSLLSSAMKSDFEHIEEYLLQRTNPYGTNNNHIELARRVMGPLQRKQLRRLINFRFTESDLCNLPGWRIRALEEIIQNRVKELLIH